MRNHRQILIDYWRQYIPTWYIPKGYHVHHIVPLSAGGTDDPRNLIALHPDDHVTIHEMRGDRCTRNHVFLKEHTFKPGYEPWNKGKKLHYEVWNKGKKLHYETVRTNPFQPGNVPWNKGRKYTKGPEKRLVCEHCGKETSGGNYVRWHGENCKGKNR